jgi:hypothetical protein
MAAKRKTTSKTRDVPQVTSGPAVERTFRLVPVVSPDMVTHYVDNINVIHTQTEFTVSFMQSQPPFVADDKQLDSIKTIQSKCVSRIVVSPMKWGMILAALNENFKQYLDFHVNKDNKNANDNGKTKDNATSG